ncbi:dihydrolipoamide acetyltransferase family protein [Arthrobacter sp. JSM 101049]|uniref:dihydrolipoamide acetyltransferase family protein n=1 Tax=Arthrobacter sp. JSM 101049 TaxID=929097 RepID=UPI00356A7044
MAIKVFLLPDLGEGLTEADLVNWLVAEGDTIAVDQPIAEVETAKSLVEVPSPFAGTVHQLHGAPGDTVDVGKPLVSVEEGAASDRAATPAAASPAAGEQAQSYRDEERAGASEGSGNVLIGYGTPGGTGATSRRRRPRGAEVPAPAPSAPEAAKPTSTPAPAPTPMRSQAPIVVSPLVRRLARDHGIDVATLAGSGADGLVMRADVQAAIDGAGAPEAPAARATGAEEALRLAAATGADARSGLGITERTPLKGVRKSIAQAMSTSRREIPEATVWVDVDATALVEMRAQLKAADPRNTPGLLAFIARFTLAGLARYPELNTRVQDSADGGQEIISFDGVNLGIAAQTDRGLMVPSIANAQDLSARQLDAEVRRLAAVAREGKCTPAELTRGTFTLNNYGVFGVDGSAAIINYPEVAILGVGRIIDRPWVVEGELRVRKVTELTLTFDHRVCDGGTAGGFLRYVADAIENPGSVLADL